MALYVAFNNLSNSFSEIDNGGMRTEQHEFRVNVLAAGATYAVVRSIDDVAALGL